MYKYNYLFFGNEILSNSVPVGFFFYTFNKDGGIDVYKQTQKTKRFIKTVENYGELAEYNNEEESTSNIIFLNP